MTNNQAYYNSLPNNVYSFKESFDANWIDTPRSDVWAVDHDSRDGSNDEVRTTEDLTLGDSSTPVYPTGIQPLSVGFGNQGRFSQSGANLITPSTIGPELGLGHNLGDAMNSPVLLFKSSRGGTNITTDWRPPSAGGTIGSSYTNTVNLLKSQLDALDADLGDDGVLNGFNDATGYAVAGLIWLQGWNDRNTDGATYQELLVDLVEDLRASDARLADDLPAVIVESADQSETLNAARAGAAATLNADNPGSAIFVEINDLVGEDYGGTNVNGESFNTSFGSHFNSKAENYLELGYRIGDAIVENGFTGSEVVPEPSSLGLFVAGGLLLGSRRRRNA